MTRPVTLLFFTQTLECETCLQTRHILDELPPLSDNIAVDEVNFVPDLARRYHVTSVPKTVVDDTVEILGAIPEEDFIEQAPSQCAPRLHHEDTKTTKSSITQ